MEGKIDIRTWKPDDLDSLVKYADNFNVACKLRDLFPHPYTIEDGKAYIQKNLDTAPPTSFAITLEENAIGSIGLKLMDDIHRKNAEIGYWIGEPFWRQGILPKVIPRMVRHGFETFDIDRIFAVVSHMNIGSRKVLERSGFSLEAKLEKTLFKLGEYHDELIYAIRKNG